MYKILITGLKMKLDYETQEIEYARAFLTEIAEKADFSQLQITIFFLDEEKVKQAIETLGDKS